ncbi:MAG: ABC transporter ATP-binding protein, partial [Acidobacteria bacterium]|nr:ABC transporter ATP-binding protein [Acidobacteriota bacterium]
MYHFEYREAPKGLRPTRGDFARIARYLLPAWRPSVLILGCILVTSLLGLIPPLLIREIIDRAIPEQDSALLGWLVAGMIGAPLISGLIGVWMNYLVTVMSQGVMFDLRNEMYGKLLRQSLRFFTNIKSGEILSRIQNDVGGVQGVVSGTLVSLATNALVVVTTLVVLFR